MRILAFVGFLGPTFLLQAADVVGHLSADTGATVSARGLAVTLTPRQEYPLFSGDRAQTNAEPGSSVLALPEAGHITLAADTAVSVERSQGRFLLDVERGQPGFDLVPGAPVFLLAGGQQIHLAEGSGKGGVSVDAEAGYLVMVDPAGDVRITLLDTEETIYQGEAQPELINAQGAAAPIATAGDPGVRTGIPSTETSKLPLVVGALAAILALIDTDRNVFRQDRPTEPPISPVRP